MTRGKGDSRQYVYKNPNNDKSVIVSKHKDDLHGKHWEAGYAKIDPDTGGYSRWE